MVATPTWTVPYKRREFLGMAAAAALTPALLRGQISANWSNPGAALAEEERGRVLSAANAYLRQAPATITSVRAVRSAGGLHDFYSEGDYWWPDPKDPNGPYIQRDGMSNPANFTAHRELMVRLSLQMPALAAAWKLTRERAYAERAVEHLRAWFVTPATRMNPNLEYAQAIHGRDTGRSIGIIDTVHLCEVAQAARVLLRGGALADADVRGTQGWFTEYLAWLTTSKRGEQERDTKNNHASCWLLQAASFAALTGDDGVTGYCRTRLQQTILTDQLAPNGSFPRELARTKPYSYSLFNLDIIGVSAQVLSTPGYDLWAWRGADGRSSDRSLEQAFRFLMPYVADKSTWPYKKDVEYWNDLPVRQPSLLFAALAYREPSWIAVWRRLDPDPTVAEIIRNHPVRQPLLWLGSA